MSIETIKKKHSRYINAIIKCASEVSGFSATSNIDETLFMKVRIFTDYGIIMILKLADVFNLLIIFP